MLHLALNLTLFVARRLLARGRVLGLPRRAAPEPRASGSSGPRRCSGSSRSSGRSATSSIRPPETRDEVKTRRIEVEALESWLRRERAALPHLPRRRRGHVPRLPGLHDPAEGAVRRAARRRSRPPGSSAPSARSRRGAGGLRPRRRARPRRPRATASRRPLRSRGRRGSHRRSTAAGARPRARANTGPQVRAFSRSRRADSNRGPLHYE